MENVNVLSNLIDRCDIFFEGSLISKEWIIKKYADFISTALTKEGHSISIALHPNSICFDVVSFLLVALGCIYKDKTESTDILESLQDDDLVLYRKERYIWKGFSDKDCNHLPNTVINERHFAILTQPTKTTNSKEYVSKGKWHFIVPYKGDSQVTDGRGIRKQSANRNSFISCIFDTPPQTVPSITGVSIIIVSEYELFDRISKGLEINYGEKKQRISLLDLVTASYYTSNKEMYQYGKNPAKAEPVLKVTNKVSTARELIFSNHRNKTVGLIILGSRALTKGTSELEDLMGRDSLNLVHIATGVDFEKLESIIETEKNAALFACTREFLLQGSCALQECNPLTIGLNRQIEKIVNRTTTIIDVDCEDSWSDVKKVREVLCNIRNSEWNEDKRKEFLIAAHSLLTLFTTAVFSMKTVEDAVKSKKLNRTVTSPWQKICTLREFAKSAEAMNDSCMFVMDVLEHLYQSIVLNCPKCEALKAHLDVIEQRLNMINNQKIALVIPKAYYTHLIDDPRIKKYKIDIVTANCFNNTVDYDEVITVGDFSGTHFDPLKCNASKDITVLLYECERLPFEYKKRKGDNLKKKLNLRLGIANDKSQYEKTKATKVDVGEEEINIFAQEFPMLEQYIDLKQYIDSISVFDIRKFATQVSTITENTPTSEVYAIGRFSSGAQILFSKFYSAVVFDSMKKTVVESRVQRLAIGDSLIFTKRDNDTRNMVDIIYETLRLKGKIDGSVLDATKNALYWKDVLRKYKDNRNLSFGDVASELQKHGSTLQEISIRQWLIEESHIVGPRDEKTLVQIAKLTQDSNLLNNTHDYYEAIKTARRYRLKILKLISVAINEKFRGHTPPKGSDLEFVFENVKDLSETLELEDVSLLDTPLMIPIHLVNKPITEKEVSI